jgi:hypothetical protein
MSATPDPIQDAEQRSACARLSLSVANVGSTRAHWITDEAAPKELPKQRPLE